MPYTLSMGLVWVVLAVLLGTLIGWLLRSVAARRQLERVRAEANDESELERLRTRVANLEPVVNERDRLRIELETLRATLPAEPAAGTTPTRAVVDQLERSIDDLTVVVGIDDEIADLCRNIGISTWAELSVTQVSLLRTMLTDAGRSLDQHDPSTWPEQAQLLAARSWSDFMARFADHAGQRVDD